MPKHKTEKISDGYKLKIINHIIELTDMGFTVELGGRYFSISEYFIGEATKREEKREVTGNYGLDKFADSCLRLTANNLEEAVMRVKDLSKNAKK